MPLISLVIPTRNRLFYLRDSLQTALNQNDPDLEIIVADNATDDGTKEYLASLGSKVKTTRSEVPLAMGDNWCRGLDMVTSDWVIVIGDDDGLMPNFMSTIKSVIPQVPQIEVITSEYASYRWPDCATEQNMLSFSISSRTRQTSGLDGLKGVFEDINGIMNSPGLYHTVTKRSVIERAKKFFGEYRLGTIPDLGSGLLHLAVLGQYISLGRPLTVMGFGKKSIGMSFKIGGDHKTPAQEFRQLSNMDEVLKNYLPEIRDTTHDVLQWRVLLEWRDYMAAKGLDYTFNSPKMLEYILSHLWALPQGQRRITADAVLGYAANHGMDVERLGGVVENAMARNHIYSVGFQATEKGFRGAIDLTGTPITCVSEAAALVRSFLPR